VSYTISYTLAAESDLDGIRDYIARDNLFKAIEFVESIEKRILRLSESPLLGKEPDDPRLRKKGRRVLVYNENYEIYYTADAAQKLIRVVSK
jgi:plasmid stabilization system protein ParE